MLCLMELTKHINANDGDVKAATAVRTMENVDFVKTNRDYSESVDALERAIVILGKQNYDRKQAKEVLVQASDEEYKSKLDATCASKRADFAERQKLRSEEKLEAIEKAIEILSSKDVAGNAATHLPSFYQRAKESLSFLQITNNIRKVHSSPSSVNRVVNYLKNKSDVLNSRVLSTLAVRVEQGALSDDPFKKVTQMINDLIMRLQQEATAEASQKGWCDKNLKENEMDRKQFRKDVQKSATDVDQFSARIAKLTNQVKELSKEIAELNSALADATEKRSSERKENEDTIQDAKDGQTAVAQALVVLKEFYDKAGQAVALTQQDPEIFEAPYTGMQAEKGGVVGMLEVIQSDFARLESETTAAESKAQDDFNTFKAETSKNVAVKETDVTHKTQEKLRKENALQNAKTDLKSSQKQLAGSMRTFDKLKPPCVDAGVSYEDRVSRRHEEIQSLQEALRILSGEDLA